MRLTWAGAPGQPHQFAGARGRRIARVQPLPLHRDRRDLLDAADHLDLVAVRLGQPHALAAAGLVDVLDARGAGRLGELLQLVLVVDVIGDADEFRVALLGDVEVVRRIGAAHIERVGGALRPVHAETGEEFLRHVEIGRPEPSVSDIGYFRPSHMCSPREFVVPDVRSNPATSGTAGLAAEGCTEAAQDCPCLIRKGPAALPRRGSEPAEAAVN